MKKLSLLTFLSIAILILSSMVIAQTTYQGPATGSVTSGVVVNTDNFIFAKGEEILSKPQVLELMKNEVEPLYLYGDGSVSDNYFYVENGTEQGGFEIGTSFELHSFESIGYQNLWPPDPAMSVGPNHVIAAVNGRFHIYDREGNLLKNISESAWISNVVNTPLISDPQVIYDHYYNKWVMLWFTRDASILQAPFIICHSDDENPLGIWYMYAINSELNGSTYAGNWGDYPKIGYDDQALYINSRQFSFAGGYQYNKIRILNSIAFYAAQGGPVSWTDIWNIRVNNISYDVIHPYYSYDSGQNAAYFVYARSGGANFYQLFKITDPITNPVLTSVPLPTTTYQTAPSAQQLGGPAVDNFTWICKAPVLRDGLLYASHAIRNSQYPQYSSLKYFVINVNTNTIVEQVEQGENGYFFIQPALTVDKDHNIAITYSKSSSTSYIGAYYSTRLNTDPPGLSRSKLMTEGQSAQNQTRWGDYFSAAVDPVNQYDIWLFCEFAKNGNWSTWLTEIRMKLYPGAHAYAKSFIVDFGNLELGSAPITKTVTLRNYGEDDLIVSSVNIPVGPFTLLTSIPFTLAPFDSIDLEFEFDPTDAVVYDELMSFTNNDPNFPGFTMKGRGFEINETMTNVFYAISNATFPDTGKTIWLDKGTAVGTELGLSNFADIRALTVDPETNIMYGIVPGATSSNLVRVNATEGDAYTLFTLDGLGFGVGVAFDTAGVLYGALQNGEIHTINLITGTTTLITTTVQLTSIAFDPLTNDLWATPRVVVGQKDRIFKIDLATGDTTIIGRTGFNVQTNDLAFDETGALYGVIGGATQVGKLISIDRTTAVGTEIGETGFANLQALAYRINGSVSSADEKDIIPTEFALKQNYPNPFNPTTKIEFSLPVAADVELIVYNILGQQVARLINEQRSAGNHSIFWKADDSKGMKLSSGIYLYKIKATGNDGSEFQEIKKMVLLK